MNFQVPQFIDIENKIVGPLTLRQFLYLAGAGLISFMLFFVFPMGLWLLITVFLGVIALALAFIKYNSQPLPKILWLALGFTWKPRLYLWQRELTQKEIKIPQMESAISQRERLKKFVSEMPSVKKLWQELLTTKNPVPQREKAVRTPFWGKQPKEKFQLFRKLTGEKEMARRVDYR